MVTVRALSEYEDPDAALGAYARVDATSFGGPPDPADLAAKRPLIDPSRWYLAEIDGEPCGGSGAFAFDMTVPGGATVPVSGVSDVGVLPTHRRRGALSTLMARLLSDAAHRGDVAAVLHASEATIYRRFGFGVGTRWRQVEVDTRRAAFRDGWPDPGGRYRTVARQDAAKDCAAVHDRARLLHPGSLSRSDDWWRVVLGDVELYLGGGTSRMVVVHDDDGGTADGYVIYDVATDWSSGQASHSLRVWELVGTSSSVELGLWRAMLDHDLVARVSGPAPVDHPLFDVVDDVRQARTRWEQDLLWVRLLDVPGALASRTYRADGSLVLQVDDRFRPGTGGTFRLTADRGSARCEPVDGAVDLRLDTSDLGGAWLGATSFRRLARAGRVDEGRPGAAVLGDAMFGVEPAPWCWVRF